MKAVMKWVFWGLVGLAIVAVAVYLFTPKPIGVDIAVVSRGPLAVTVEQDGQTRVRDRYVVAAPLAGKLRRITQDEGDPVVAGQTVLAVIEPAEPALLDWRTRLGAEAAVGAAEAAVAEAQTRIERAEAELAQARRELARLEALAARRAGATDVEVERAALAVDTREADLRGARFGLEIAEFQRREAQAALARMDAADRRQDEQGGQAAGEGGDASAEVYRLVAPVSGVVLRVVQESETVVTPGTALLEIGAPRDLEAVIDVLSQDAARIVPGATVRLERWGGDEPLPGVVRRIEPSGFTKISALGVEEQRVNVIVDFTPPEDGGANLGDGYRVDAAIVTWEEQDVLQVPTAALFRQESDWATFVIRDGRAVLQRLRLGAMNAAAAQVIEGLAEGDRVILYPSDQVEAGVLVERRGGESSGIGAGAHGRS